MCGGLCGAKVIFESRTWPGAGLCGALGTGGEDKGIGCGRGWMVGVAVFVVAMLMLFVIVSDPALDWDKYGIIILGKGIECAFEGEFKENCAENGLGIC